MIVITGAAGFIGSNMVAYMNRLGNTDIVIVDDFSNEAKSANFCNLTFTEKIHRDDFFTWLNVHRDNVEFIFHLGARTNTAEFDVSVFEKLNLGYSKQIWNTCSFYKIPLIYASSAATYGDGSLGYNDDHDIIYRLNPLNPYGESKNDFDKWALEQKSIPPFWAGLKFFNVYGPNEYHKGRMASVIFHAYNQIRETGKMRLFRSHREGIPDGGQSRDFVYVKDVVSVIHWLFINQPSSGLYNLGTGKARSFLDLTKSTFRAMGIKPDIEFIDTPIDIRDKYQYFTEANMQKLRKAGYEETFYCLEDGVSDYVTNYLVPGQIIEQ
ncbi:MAG TPA: ADP-glyceromanno-heptose 6-epimerase [Bacteroidales bacterium]|nr:ADP-glyceromanno-heptose 6-epimerase [Bacteroidales bacterium]